MNYVRTMIEQGIDLTSLSDCQFELLKQAMKQEEERREREMHMRLIAEYTGKLHEFIAELDEYGLVLEYNDYKNEFIIMEGE